MNIGIYIVCRRLLKHCYTADPEAYVLSLAERLSTDGFDVRIVKRVVNMTINRNVGYEIPAQPFIWDACAMMLQGYPAIARNLLQPGNPGRIKHLQTMKQSQRPMKQSQRRLERLKRIRRHV